MATQPAGKKNAAPGRHRSTRGTLSWLGLGKRYHQATRLRQILAVLARYGFGELASRLDVYSAFRLRRRIIPEPPDRTRTTGIARGQRLVRALEELGPTFIKFGQVLSTRPDILPPDFITALSELQDHVPGFPVQDVARVLEEELQLPPDKLFAEFDHEPLAAASLSQVHRARLITGEEVAVKIQRPNIEETIESDLAILENVARLVEHRLPQYAIYDPRGLVQEFGRALRKELDFVREGQNCDICRAQFRDDPGVIIPRVFPAYTSRRVLTLEYLTGIKVTDFHALAQNGIDRRRLAIAGCIVYMKMIFEHGFFQADPHPGNLRVRPDGSIIVFDYGMFSRISEEDRHRIVDLMLAAFDRRADLIVRLVLEAGRTGGKIDEASFRNDVQDLLDRYYGVELQKIPVAQVARELLSALRHYRIRTPPGFTMLVRGLGTVEGLGLVIDPEFNFTEQMRPFVERSAREQISWRGWLRMLRRSRGDAEILLHNLPNDLRAVLDRIKKGQLELVLDPEEFRKIGTSLQRSNDRLAVAIVLAAIIVGASLLVFAAPTLFRGIVPVIGVVGFLAAAVLGVWLLITTLRGGRF
jgi:ubiquinone biosynthesis protein